MTAPSPDERTYDEAEVALILRAAADLEHASVVSSTRARNGLTLRQIQAIAAEAGLDTQAVAAAAVRVSAESRDALSHRFDHVHVSAGELTEEARDRLADAIRRHMGPVDVRPTSAGLEIEAKNSELGALLITVRSAHGSTTVQMWSERSKLGIADAAGYSLLGIIPSLFTAVAVAGGQWPALGAFAALVAGGAGAGTAVGLGAWRWRTDRWRRRLTNLMEFVVSTTSELAAQHRADDSDGDPRAATPTP